MANTKRHESKPVSRGGTLSEHTTDWINLFIKHFELNLLDASHSLPPDASESDYRFAAIRAMFETVLDSGVDGEVLAETVGKVLIEERQGSIEWNSDLNQRRFELIDKAIQESLTPSESIELAGLTRTMREHLESEANLPMEGAKALHRKLRELAAEDNPS
jgi:hypothetical protein